MLPIAVQPQAWREQAKQSRRCHKLWLPLRRFGAFHLPRTSHHDSDRDGYLLSTEGYSHSHDDPYIQDPRDQQLQTPLQTLPATNRNEEQVGALQASQRPQASYGMGLLRWRLEQHNTE